MTSDEENVAGGGCGSRPTKIDTHFVSNNIYFFMKANHIFDNVWEEFAMNFIVYFVFYCYMREIGEECYGNRGWLMECCDAFIF